MSTHLLGHLAFATVPALIMLTAMTASPAAAVVNIDACQTLDRFGETYRVTQDLSSCGNCLTVANDRITIDLQEQSIQSACPATETGDGITDLGIARVLITVKNGSVFNYNGGINLLASKRITLRNVTASDNIFGISVGSQSLVKDCHVHGNLLVGIEGGDRVQVEGCNVSLNAGFGMLVSDKCLIQRNEVQFNGITGIISGQSCTVAHNVANSNGVSGVGVGISVGTKTLVTQNEANNNMLDGIFVVCPSTVTNNTATGNGLFNYEFIRDGCHTNNNKE